MTLKVIQTNMTSGVLDPKLAAREDLTFYFNGMASAKNQIFLPQGGSRRRPGKQWVRELLPQLQSVSIAGATMTAPQGGTAANARDGSETSYLTTTNNIASTNPFVILHIDHGAAKATVAVDLINIFLSSGSLADEIFVQYSSDNATWFNFGTAIDLDASTRSRRRSAATVVARYWRVVRIGTTATAATVSIGEIRFWSVMADLSYARLVPFAYSTAEAYMMVATDKNLDVMTGETWHCSVAMPHVSDQLGVLNWTQNLDTLLLFHADVQPWRVFRQGSSDEFDFRKQEFENIPQYDYGAGVGGVNEQQRINTSGNIVGTNKFTILLEGERTAQISGNATPATVASNIQAALEALPSVGSGNVTVTLELDGSGVTKGFLIDFINDAGKRPWEELSISFLGGTAVMDVARVVKGEYEGEDIISDSRGWPRCGTFYAARGIYAGFKSVPDGWVASVLDDRFNLDTSIENATKALQFRAESDQVSAIYNVFQGRHLTFFTNDGEYYLPNAVLNDEAIMKLAASTGSKEGLRVYEVDGALIFIQGVKDENDNREIATSVREFIFVDTEQSYQAAILSKLSGHLIKNPVDVALRRSLSTDEADILLMVNEDGTGTAYTMLRNDAVNAFAPVETRAGDLLLAVGVDKKRRVFWIVERIIAGVARRFIEIWNDDLYLDCGGIVTITAEEFTATEGQDEYTWTFDNPLSAAAIGVRLNGGRLGAADYEVDLGTKTVTLSPEIAAAVAAGAIVRIAKMVNEVTGLGHLSGETLQTYIDGAQGDDVTVTAGTFTLAEYADTEIQYGFDFEVTGALMPLRLAGQQTLVDDKVRVVNAIFQLYETSGLEIRANNGNWQEVPLVQTDAEVLDRSQDELLFTGTAVMQGLKGYAVGAPLEYRQPGPGPFTLLGITREVSL